MKNRLADRMEVSLGQGFFPCGGKIMKDISIEQRMENGNLAVTLTSEESRVCFLRLRWSFSASEQIQENVKVLGDAWERSYGDLAWLPLDAERRLPWVCAVSNGTDSTLDYNGRWTMCFGVKTQPGAFCLWQLDQEGVTLTCDVRNGGTGVLLRGRTLNVCEIVMREYRDVSAFQALTEFYRLLCDHPLRPDAPIYGANNWYYAYGKSSAEEIRQDTALISRLSGDAENRPFMVIDDGWQRNPTDGPWDKGNVRFPDMKGLCADMKALQVKPGLWVRYLADEHKETPGITNEMRLSRNPHYLDPSRPAVLQKVIEDTKRFTEDLGYQLIKHDFSTCDIFGFWGFQRKGFLAEDGWRFFDQTKTSAEIIVQFYRTIFESAAPGTVILGCNVIGHLAAGLVHLNRTGDDTSGVEWARTKKMGVNTLAFRLPQHRAFFDMDADCVGITGKIDWKKNSQWLRLLSVSGTPLFVSCQPDQAKGQIEADLQEAFRLAAVQQDTLIPLDWMENPWPERWMVNGEEIHFSWDEK